MLIGRRTVTTLTNTQIRAMMNEVQTQEMTAAQRMEKQFFIQMIQLVNEVQGKQKLPSHLNSFICPTQTTNNADQNCFRCSNQASRLCYL